ncbi:amidohydrolase family protein [Lentzea sp. NPDC051213]|uniref:amidohydrolase family protein n=1 Tax=Lentzea sp. NPDC051213 TaxID=3364126 RepID=UPI003799167F
MKTLITGGTVLTMDPATGDLARGDVLITDGVITAVAERIDAPDAEVIDATGRIVMPGFVDTHRHTWQTQFRGLGTDWTFADYVAAIHGTVKPEYQPEDVYLANLVGRLEALNSGITTMLDWFHAAQTPAHADAALAGLRDAPARSIFGYGAGYRTTDRIDAEIRRVRAEVPDDGLVTMALAMRGPGEATMDLVVNDVKLANELDLRISVHVDGLSGARPIAEMFQHGVLGDTTTFVHANGLDDDELRMIADAGASVSISPDVELKMGFGWPETGRMLAAGLRPTLSIDDCPAVGGDMFSTMRTTFSVQRGLDGGLQARDVLQFATVDGARACGLGSRTGSLTPGKDADVILLRADDLSVFPLNHPAGTIVAAGHPGLVDTVLVAGRVVKRDGALVGVDVPALKARLLASRDRIAAAAGVGLDGTWRPTASE